MAIVGHTCSAYCARRAHCDGGSATLHCGGGAPGRVMAAQGGRHTLARTCVRGRHGDADQARALLEAASTYHPGCLPEAPTPFDLPGGGRALLAYRCNDAPPTVSSARALTTVPPGTSVKCAGAPSGGTLPSARSASMQGWSPWGTRANCSGAHRGARSPYTVEPPAGISGLVEVDHGPA